MKRTEAPFAFLTEAEIQEIKNFETSFNQKHQRPVVMLAYDNTGNETNMPFSST